MKIAANHVPYGTWQIIPLNQDLFEVILLQSTFVLSTFYP
jgi:hypothetical protein